METMTMEQYLLGGLDTTFFLACLIFAAIGILISMLIEATERDVDSTNTPVKFSWRFLFQDHWQRILLTMLVIYICIIFTPQLLGVTINTFVALMLGLGFKFLLKYVKAARKRFYSNVKEKTAKKK